MTNFEKYFKDPKTASETIEKIIFKQIDVCKDLCNFGNLDCEKNSLLADYSCCHGIRYFLEQKCEEEKNNAK